MEKFLQALSLILDKHSAYMLKEIRDFPAAMQGGRADQDSNIFIIISYRRQMGRGILKRRCRNGTDLNKKRDRAIRPPIRFGLDVWKWDSWGNLGQCVSGRGVE